MILPLTAGLKALLSRERGNHAEFVFTYLCQHSGPERIRGRRYPLVLDGGNFLRAWVRARNAIGLPRLRFHDLRHTFATRLAAIQPLNRVQRALGHSDIRTTARYATSSFEDVRQALEALEWTQIGHKAVSEPPKAQGKSNA